MSSLLCLLSGPSELFRKTSPRRPRRSQRPTRSHRDNRTFGPKSFGLFSRVFLRWGFESLRVHSPRLAASSSYRRKPVSRKPDWIPCQARNDGPGQKTIPRSLLRGGSISRGFLGSSACFAVQRHYSGVWKKRIPAGAVGRPSLFWRVQRSGTWANLNWTRVPDRVGECREVARSGELSSTS